MSGNENSYLMTKGYCRFKIRTEDVKRPLVTGFYHLIRYEMEDTTVVIKSADDLDFMGTVAPSTSYMLNDLVYPPDIVDYNKGIYKDQRQRFDLCGMLIEKIVPFRSGTNKNLTKTLFRMLTLNNVAVIVEVWYTVDNIYVPKVNDCIVLRDCFFHGGTNESFLKTRSEQGLQWRYVSNHDWFQGVFKANAQYVPFTDIKSNSKHHFLNYRPCDPSWDTFELRYPFETDEILKTLPASAFNTRQDTLKTIVGSIKLVDTRTIVNKIQCDDCTNVVNPCVVEGKHTAVGTLGSRCVSVSITIKDAREPKTWVANIPNINMFKKYFSTFTGDFKHDWLENKSKKFIFHCRNHKNVLTILDVDSYP